MGLFYTEESEVDTYLKNTYAVYLWACWEDSEVDVYWKNTDAVFSSSSTQVGATKQHGGHAGSCSCLWKPDQTQTYPWFPF